MPLLAEAICADGQISVRRRRPDQDTVNALVDGLKRRRA